MKIIEKILVNELGEAAVERALGVMGSTFFRDPHAAMNPDMYYSSDTIIAQGRKDFGPNDALRLAGQGPLPIEIGGTTIMVQAAAFQIGGYADHHGLAIFPHVMPKDIRKDATLDVVVEDHVGMVMQHLGKGGVWAMVDDSLKKSVLDGGGVLLLPECMDNLSSQKLNQIGADAANLVGFKNHKLLSNRHMHGLTYLPTPIRNLSRVETERARVISAEWVILPFSQKPFKHFVYSDPQEPKDLHHAWVYGDLADKDAVPVRVHSACSSSEVLGAINCDCPDQLDATMQHIVSNGYGVLMYMGGKHEGRGHGIRAKVATWPLNIGDRIDLLTAFNAAGLKEDVREFGPAAEFLKNCLGVQKIEFLSNNMKVKALPLERLGVEIVRTRSVVPAPRHDACAVDHAAKQGTRGDDFSSNGIDVDMHVLLRH